MLCYACGTETTFRCRRCGKAYCERHGTGPFCAACLEPASLLPSPAIFRGSLLALLASSVIAFWLLLRPPSLPEGKAEESSGVVRTPAPTAAASSPTPAPTSPTPAPTPTPTVVEYTVQSGDTLVAIAQRFGVAIDAIISANNLADPNDLTVGQRLRIPRSP